MCRWHIRTGYHHRRSNIILLFAYSISIHLMHKQINDKLYINLNFWHLNNNQKLVIIRYNFNFTVPEIIIFLKFNWKKKNSEKKYWICKTFRFILNNNYIWDNNNNLEPLFLIIPHQKINKIAYIVESSILIFYSHFSFIL